MPVFRGNVGNLLQHWVFCEILEALRNSADEIQLIDAYAMAPLANERPTLDRSTHLFDCAQRDLPGARTAYERAWHCLAPSVRSYPNSANLLTRLWSGRYSLLLCEAEPTTADQLRLWAVEVRSLEKCARIEIAEGDWRRRFRQGLVSSADVTLLSFDPYMFDRHGSGRNLGNMDPGDFALLSTAVEPIQGSLVLQLSTFSANNDNRQTDVIEVMTSGLKASGLQLLGVVRADGNMMSLILGRNVGVASSLGALPRGFDSWLAHLKMKCQTQSSSPSSARI
jgi:hypothetical protein